MASLFKDDEDPFQKAAATYSHVVRTKLYGAKKALANVEQRIRSLVTVTLTMVILHGNHAKTMQKISSNNPWMSSSKSRSRSFRNLVWQQVYTFVLRGLNAIVS